MLWIDDIVESTPISSFFINSRIDMADFVNPHKVVVRLNAFSAWYDMKMNQKMGAKSEKLSRQFSQMESNMNLQEILKLIPIPKKKAI